MNNFEQSKLSRCFARVPGLLLLGMVLGLVALGGCDSSANEDDGRLTVVATTTMIADLARQIAGDDARVEGIMRTGEDPHIYDVTPRAAEMIRSADLVLMNGLHLEATLGEIIANSAGDLSVALAEQDGIVPLTGGSGLSVAPDPHCWMDVNQFRLYAEKARDALIAADPAHAEGYRKRAEAYIAELVELDKWVREQFDTVPKAQRVIVTSHDAFAYFGRAYEIEVHGVIGISTEQEPTPQHIEALQKLVSERGVRALFLETSVSNTLNQIVQSVAGRSGASIGGTLYSDSLGDAGSGADTYIGMIRQNTTTIVKALKGGLNQ